MPNTKEKGKNNLNKFVFIDLPLLYSKKIWRKFKNIYIRKEITIYVRKHYFLLVSLLDRWLALELIFLIT
jgi:hypothetical protein